MTTTLSREQLRSDVADVLDEAPDAFADDDNLIDWGLDSIRLMTLATRWRAHGVAAGLPELAREPTVDAWAKLLRCSG